MVLGQVQGFKVEVVGFHFRAFFHLKPHMHKDFLDFPQGLGNRVQVPQGRLTAGQGNIQGFGSQFFFHLTGFQHLHLFVDPFLHLGPDFVDHFADFRPFFRSHIPQGTKNGGQGPLLAQVLHTDIFQVFYALYFTQILLDLFPQFLQLVTHSNAS